MTLCPLCAQRWVPSKRTLCSRCMGVRVRRVEEQAQPHRWIVQDGRSYLVVWDGTHRNQPAESLRP